MRKPGTERVDDPVVARIIELLEEQSRTQKQLTEYLGLANGVFTKWRYHGGKSYMTHIDRIAEFFGVTRSDLLTGLDTDVSLDTLTESEIELVKNYRSLTDEARKVISANVKLLAGN
jgi:transcriptional regulator with XRE-family HTH domain